MFIVSGIVQDEKGAPLELANVMVTDAAGKGITRNGVVAGRQTDEKGGFNIPVIDDNDYITISYVGLGKLTVKGKEAQTTKVFQLGSNNVLNEVVVTAKKAVKNQPKWLWWLAGVLAFAFVAAIIFLIIKKNRK